MNDVLQTAIIVLGVLIIVWLIRSFFVKQVTGQFDIASRKNHDRFYDEQKLLEEQRKQRDSIKLGTPP